MRPEHHWCANQLGASLEGKADNPYKATLAASREPVDYSCVDTTGQKGIQKKRISGYTQYIGLAGAPVV